jgi:hypothetical protein
MSSSCIGGNKSTMLDCHCGYLYLENAATRFSKQEMSYLRMILLFCKMLEEAEYELVSVGVKQLAYIVRTAPSLE